MGIEEIGRTHEDDRGIVGIPFPGSQVAMLMFQQAFEHREFLLAEVERLQAEAAALREALEAVRWIEHDEGFVYCPWCGVSPSETHLSDCQGEKALTTDAGRPFLERLRRNEERLADCMTEIQTAHGQIDQWNFGVPTHDGKHELSLSQRISDLCRWLVKAKAERDEARAAFEALSVTVDAAAGNPPPEKIW